MPKCAWFACLVVVWGICLSGCAAGTEGSRFRGDGGTADATSDATSDPDAGRVCSTNADCADDGFYCNGGYECREHRCVATAVPTCEDFTECTRDSCVTATDMCQHVPDDSACPPGYGCYPGIGCATAPPCEFDADCSGDGNFCNGVEVCVEHVCTSPGMRDCADADSCSADECVESMGMCMHTPYDMHLTDVLHCGPTGLNDCVICPVPPPTGHAHATCVEGGCGFECDEGWFDRNGIASDYCESDCSPSTDVDVPDDGFEDINCDGIDGDIERAIFVSTAGSDSNDGLSIAHPAATINRALTIAGVFPRRNQIVAENGSYSTTSTLSWVDGIGLYGGYTENYAVRSNTTATLNSTAPTAVVASNLTLDTTFDRVNLSTDSRVLPSTGSLVFISRDNDSHLSLRNLELTAGRGGDGANGMMGTDGDNGLVGSPGSGSSGGSGSTLGGGAGGTGRSQDWGPGGTGGSANGSTCGGSAGSWSTTYGLGCNDGDPANGGDGGDGCTGANGGGGVAGNGLGSLSSTGVWTASNGGTGSTGVNGGGGGGGGAGGGEDCTDPVFDTCIYCGTGRGGGGGGGGGRGATGGTGGGGGGASVALVIINSTVHLTNVVLHTGGGGNGGAGASGGQGGDGREGGPGQARDSNRQGSGGHGGHGGNGGDGGCGGGGGGGPSIGVWGVDSGAGVAAIDVTGTVSYMLAPGGGAGGTCAGGNAGAVGVATERQGVSTL